AQIEQCAASGAHTRYCQDAGGRAGGFTPWKTPFEDDDAQARGSRERIGNGSSDDATADDDHVCRQHPGAPRSNCGRTVAAAVLSSRRHVCPSICFMNSAGGMALAIRHSASPSTCIQTVTPSMSYTMPSATFVPPGGYLMSRVAAKRWHTNQPRSLR